MKLNTLRTGSAAAAVLALSFSLAACGSSDSEGATGSDTPAASSTSSAAENGGTEVDPASQTFGDGCAAVPTDPNDKGSFAGMVQDPVATAASNNPILTTLVAAVGATELGDTLNSADALTVFAPYDPAFTELGTAVTDLVNGVADADSPQTSPLAQILTHHVLGASDDPTAVVGEQTTLNGDTLTVKGDAETGMTVSDGTVTANVICGNIPTANATVYVIDKVLTGATVK
ncbi:fasciclin domain-containing protein [soil metagenome]